MKRCKRCNNYFKQRKSESNYSFARRMTCSAKCLDALFNEPRRAADRLAMREFWESGMRVLAGKEENE